MSSWENHVKSEGCVAIICKLKWEDYEKIISEFFLRRAVPVYLWRAGRGRSEKETPYQKLFKGKTYETVKGLLTIHKMDGKVYFEIPRNLLEKDMLLGSTISETTNNSVSYTHLTLPTIRLV